MQERLDKYLEQLEEKTEQVREQLITDHVDGVLREHIKSILAETFAITSGE